MPSPLGLIGEGLLIYVLLEREQFSFKREKPRAIMKFGDGTGSCFPITLRQERTALMNRGRELCYNIHARSKQMLT